MKDKSPYFFALFLIWLVCFVISKIAGTYEFMYVAVLVTLFILLGTS